MQRKGLLLIFLLTIILSTNVYANGNISPDNIQSETGIKINKKPEISPFASIIASEGILNGLYGSTDISFHTGPTYPWYRIHIENDSNVDYKVNITDAYGNNHGIRWLSPNDSIQVTNNSAASGLRIVTVTSSDGSSLKGYYRIRTATSRSEL